MPHNSNKMETADGAVLARTEMQVGDTVVTLLLAYTAEDVWYVEIIGSTFDSGLALHRFGSYAAARNCFLTELVLSIG